MSTARRNGDLQLPSGEACALSRDAPAVIDKFFDVARIESQGAPSWSHFYGWQVRTALARSVLNDPRDAHAQLFRYILRPDELTNGPAVGRDNRQRASQVASIQTLH
jgi:hypothetical protein